MFLDLAVDIAVREGIDQLTMPRLAAAADTGVGTLYRYFASKDDLMADLQVHAVGAFVEHALGAVGALEGLDALRALTRSWASFRRHRPELFSLADASLSDPRQLLTDEQEASVAQTLAPALERVAQALSEATAAGHLAAGDPRLRTHALWAAIHGAEHFRKREGRSGISADTLRDELVTSLLRGWGAHFDGQRIQP